MNFFSHTGKMAIGSRLRLLTDTITNDSVALYQLYGNDLQPKWFPVFYTLSQGNFSTTELAQHIGHSHPSVSKIVAEMAKHGLILEKKDKVDGRKNVISLSKKGKELSEKIKDQYGCYRSHRNHYRRNRTRSLEGYRRMGIFAES